MSNFNDNDNKGFLSVNDFPGFKLYTGGKAPTSKNLIVVNADLQIPGDKVYKFNPENNDLLCIDTNNCIGKLTPGAMYFELDNAEMPLKIPTLDELENAIEFTPQEVAELDDYFDSLYENDYDLYDYNYNNNVVDDDDDDDEDDDDEWA
jgi:hypothetical protein